MRGVWTVTLLGVAALGGCGGGSEEENAKKKLQEACEVLCEKAYNPECQGLTVDQCKASCPLLEQQLGDACLTEYADFYGCAAGGAYECTENGPQLVSGSACVEESLAMLECRESAPCKTYCAEKAECDGTDAAACESECSAKLGSDGGYCDHDYEDLLECQGRDGLVCEGGKLKTVGCDEEVGDYAYCLASDGDVCAAFCYFADFVACGMQGQEACEAGCQAELSDAEAKACGEQFRSFRGCQLGHGLQCKDGEPSIVGCSEELYFYQSCLEGAQ